MKTKFIFVTLTMLLFARSVQAAGDIVAGGQMWINRGCANAGCHGPDPANNVEKVLRGVVKSHLVYMASPASFHLPNIPGYPFTNAPAFTDSDFNNMAAYIASRDPRTNYGITGTIKTTNNTGIAGIPIAIISPSNVGANLTTDANGVFFVNGLQPGDYFLDPSSTVYSFSPDTRNVIMYYESLLLGGTNNGQFPEDNNGVLSNANFIGISDPIRISGSVKTVGGAGIAGVAVSVPGTTNTTDATGNYELSPLNPGTYAAVPSRAGFAFIPPSLTATVDDSLRQATADFTGGSNLIVRVRRTGNDANDGSSWALAKRTVQGGIDIAIQDVWVAKGTNGIGGPLAYLENILLRPGIRLYGGFVGNETNRDQRNPAAHLTILDGNSNRAVDMQSLSQDGVTQSVVDGFTFVRGGNQGAGIQVRDTGHTVSNNRFSNNVSGSSGGAIWVSGGSPLILSNYFYGNTALVNGGAIFCDGSPVILNNLIVSNTAQSTGGAIHIRDGVVANNVIVGNTAESVDGGGGVYCSIGSVLVANNTLVGNITPPLLGGAIRFANGATPTVANNIVAFNSRGLTTITNDSLPLLLNNCVFGNTNANYSGLAAGTNDLSVDPLFVNLAAQDFHLQSLSPCVEAGTNSVLAANWRDLDGLFRQLGPSVDIGADELTTLPALQVSPSSTNQFLVCWPLWATNWIIEMTTNLSAVPILWQPTAQMPVVIGDQLCLTNGTQGTAEFYRLRHP